MTVQHNPADAAPAILAFWFDEVGKERWFAKSDALDATIRTRFGAIRDDVLATKAKAWRDSPDHLLAAIILLDQFSRNLHRGSAEAFAADPLALSLAMLALDRGWDAGVTAERRQFFLLPLMHSEQLSDQQRAMLEYAKLGDPFALRFAQLHLDQIAKFGRFPGRNAALGRRTTPRSKPHLTRAPLFKSIRHDPRAHPEPVEGSAAV